MGINYGEYCQCARWAIYCRVNPAHKHDNTSTSGNAGAMCYHHSCDRDEDVTSRNVTDHENAAVGITVDAPQLDGSLRLKEGNTLTT